jgi:hypothetical protein
VRRERTNTTGHGPHVHWTELALAGDHAELDIAVGLLFGGHPRARPGRRSSGLNRPNRLNSFRIRCSTASSSQSYGYAPSTKTAPTARSGFRLAQCAATYA